MEHLESSHQPLSLADVAHHDSDFPLDPALDDDHHDDLFLPEADQHAHISHAAPGHGHAHQTLAGASAALHSGPVGGAARELDEGTFDVETTLDDAAVSAIKASLSQAQAQAHAQSHANDGTADAHEHGHEHEHDEATPAHDVLDHLDPSLNDTGKEGFMSAAAAGRTGDEDAPTVNPPVHHAPYSRQMRDESTPHPEHIQFNNRAMFEEWLEGERSWCHLVQRRTTTPEKRAEERIKARIKAHEKMIASMTPDEAAHAPPLKRRKRARTSPVVEKITFTCHHAGSYTSKHSTDLPQSKLRLNTKRSVKCNCPARVVLTELEGGACKIMYYWRHEGHDPFADGEHDSGRLPKVVDDWLYRQIQEGKDLDDIRAVLGISEEAKAEYIRKALEDPSSVSPDMPPPTAFQMKIKYPDIYNRFRKLKGPVRLIKIPKSRLRAAAAQSGRRGSSARASGSGTPVDASQVENGENGTPSGEYHDIAGSTGASHSAAEAEGLAQLEALGHLGVIPADDPGDHHFGSGGGIGVGAGAGVGVGMGVGVGSGAHGHGHTHTLQHAHQQHHLDLSGQEMLAHFAQDSGHSELAQALMRMPSAAVGGSGEEDADAKRLEEEVMKMAKMAAESADAAEKADDGWGDFDAM